MQSLNVPLQPGSPGLLRSGGGKRGNSSSPAGSPFKARRNCVMLPHSFKFVFQARFGAIAQANGDALPPGAQSGVPRFAGLAGFMLKEPSPVPCILFAPTSNRSAIAKLAAFMSAGVGTVLLITGAEATMR